MAQILFPIFDRVLFAPIHSARAAAMEDLLAAAQATGTSATPTASVEEALNLAAEDSGRISLGGAIVISGSLYLVGEARSLLLAQGAQP
jgi:dihydrofolate synthase/folylpolyglutamate synthase